MVLEKPTCYSAIGSLGFHLVFVLMAGSSLLSQIKEPVPEKPFRLKMVTKVPPPPPVKRKKLVRPIEKQVVPVKPVVMPEPKLNPEIIKTARVEMAVEPTVSRSAPRALEPVAQLESGPVRAEKVALAAPGVANAGVVSSAAPRALRLSDSAASGSGRAVRVARVQGSGAPAGSGLGRSARALKSVGPVGNGSGRAVRVARFQGSGAPVGGGSSAPRALKSVGPAGNGSGRAVRVARFQGSGAPVGSGSSAPRALKSVGPAGSGSGRAVRVARFQEREAPGAGSAPRAQVSFGDSGIGQRVAQRFLQHAVRVNTIAAVPRAIPNIAHDKGAARGYLARIRRKIDSTKQYPPMAKNSGQQGKVRVRFTILQNGRIVGLKLLSQTPYPALNKEALEMIKRAAPFSRLPDTIGMSALEVVLPFTFQLKSQFN